MELVPESGDHSRTRRTLPSEMARARHTVQLTVPEGLSAINKLQQNAHYLSHGCVASATV